MLGTAAALAARALTGRRADKATRRSVAAAAASGAGLPVAVVIGSQFALEPGRGRSSVPVRPALIGAVVGVLGVLAAFTFAAGVTDAATHPERYGQTWQLAAFFGFNGQDGGHTAQALRAIAADPDVTGVDDAKIAGAQSGQFSVETYTYAPVGGKPVPTVLVSGQMPTTRDEIVLAPISAQQLHAKTGSVIKLAGGGAPHHRAGQRHRVRAHRAAQRLLRRRLAHPGRLQPPVRGRPLRLQVPRGHGGRAPRRQPHRRGPAADQGRPPEPEIRRCR